VQYKKQPIFPENRRIFNAVQLRQKIRRTAEAHRITASARDFGANEGLKNADILCVFQVFNPHSCGKRSAGEKEMTLDCAS